MAKQKPTPKMNVSRMLKTSRTFTTQDYKEFIGICQSQIDAKKKAELETLKKQKAELEARIKQLEG